MLKDTNKVIISLSFFFSVLIYLVPISIISGPAIPDILVTLSSILFILFSIFFRLWKYFDNNFFKFFITFWALNFFNSFFSDTILISTWNSFAYLRFGVFVIVIIFALSNNHNFFKYFSIIYIPIFLLLLFDALYQKYFGHNLVGFYTCTSLNDVPSACSRISGFFRSEWILGSYISNFFSLFLILIFSTKLFKEKKNLLILLFFFLALSAVFVTGERVSLLRILAFCSIFYLIKFRKCIYKKTTLVFFLIFIFVFSISLKNEARFNFFLAKEKELERNKLISIYHDLYSTALKMFLDRPISGHGNQSFRYKCADEKYKIGENYCNNHPHNFFFQILAENGIIGMSFFIFFYICLFKNLFRFFYLSINESIKTGVFIISLNLVLTLLPFIPSGNFYTNVSGIFLYVNIGLLYGLKYYKKYSNNFKI
jgi:O-antigen ligase